MPAIGIPAPSDLRRFALAPPRAEMALRAATAPGIRELVPVFMPPAEEADLDVVVVAIPALNEAVSIAAVVADVLAAGYQPLVVDDGSTDETMAVARRAGAVVVRHPITLGQGGALRTGIEWALAHGADIVVTMDADGQHTSADIPRLLEALQREDADFALGSRFLGETIDMPRLRGLLLRAAIWFTRVETGLKVTDTHNGLRAMTRRGAMSTRLQQNGMAHASEILGQVSASGLHWVEVPVTIQYTEASLAKGQSGLDFVAILVDLLMGRLAR
ncbi:MAG: glycosyltransferase family 2 protein [Chloroflexota bacterium]